MNTISVYNYLDYRLFLKDLFSQTQEANPRFSYRVFARKAGFTSPNFLKLVTDGKRNLTKESIYKFAKGFNFNKDEQDFFENLVFLNQSATHEEKKFYYQKLSRAKGYLKIKKIEKDTFDYYAHWYNPAIRELITFNQGKITAEKIAALLFPRVALRDVESSLELLLRLGFISQDQDNGYRQETPYLSTGPEVKSIMVKNYHLGMFEIAALSLDNFSSDQRDISCVDISLRKDQIPTLKEKIALFRKEILAMSLEDDKNEATDTILHVNLHMFPLIKGKE